MSSIYSTVETKHFNEHSNEGLKQLVKEYKQGLFVVV